MLILLEGKIPLFSHIYKKQVPVWLRDSDKNRFFYQYRFQDPVSINCPSGYMATNNIALFVILRTYSRTALILRTPAEDDCSFWIMNFPKRPVRSTWGPPHTSLEK